ncbi:MAG: hypothetical protein AAGD96_24145 [Chloroflexota bacterium]
MRWTYAIIILIVSTFTYLATNRESTLECRFENEAPICTKVITYFDQIFRERTYYEIGEARIQESCNEDGVCTISVVVETEARLNPSIEWSDGSTPNEVMRSFNQFLAGENGERFSARDQASPRRNRILWFFGGLTCLIFFGLSVDDWRRN